MDITLEELTALIDTQTAKIVGAQSARLEDAEKRLSDAIESVKKDVESLTSAVAIVTAAVASVKTDLQNLDSRVERQERRLSAIETFPLPPTRHQSRFYGTEVHSVSLPQRRRLGYAG